jgi:hypothetical protein
VTRTRRIRNVVVVRFGRNNCRLECNRCPYTLTVGARPAYRLAKREARNHARHDCPGYFPPAQEAP